MDVVDWLRFQWTENCKIAAVSAAAAVRNDFTVDMPTHPACQGTVVL